MIEKYKILICADDHDNLNILGLLLEFEGYFVIKEIDSNKVIKKIYDDKPDILLVGIWMTIICGDEIIRKILSDSKYQELPVIVFSSSYYIEMLAL